MQILTRSFSSALSLSLHAFLHLQSLPPLISFFHLRLPPSVSISPPFQPPRPFFPIFISSYNSFVCLDLRFYFFFLPPFFLHFSFSSSTFPSVFLHFSSYPFIYFSFPFPEHFFLFLYLLFLSFNFPFSFSLFFLYTSFSSLILLRLSFLLTFIFLIFSSSYFITPVLLSSIFFFSSLTFSHPLFLLPF